MNNQIEEFPGVMTEEEYSQGYFHCDAWKIKAGVLPEDSADAREKKWQAYLANRPKAPSWHLFLGIAAYISLCFALTLL